MPGPLSPLLRPRAFYHDCVRYPLKILRHRTFAFCYPGVLHHTLQFTSIGGVGTTFLYYFAEDTNLNVISQLDPGETGDYGIWKHTRHPLRENDPRGVSFRKGYRVVYVIGNPYNALISLFRRGYHYMALERLEVDAKTRDRFYPSWTLRDYLANGEDLYAFTSHILNWTCPRPPLPYPVLCIKYEHLYQELDTLFDFLDVTPGQRKRFPPQKQRKSNFDELETADQKGIRRIYQPLHDYIESLPHAFVIPAGQPSPHADKASHLLT